MKTKNILKKVRIILSAAGCLVLLTAGALAQESTVTSTGSTSGNSGSTSQSDNDTGGYNIKSSIEIGVRGRSLDGNENKYRSDLNYKAGVRVFDSTFFAETDDSDGKPFDSLLITGSGFGADPNGFARVSIEKTKFYKFDATVRKFQYFNNLLNFANNERIRNTKHTMGDFDFVALPTNRDIKFRFGYSFDRNNGPMTDTYDYDRDEFVIDADFETRANDLRVGVDGRLLGFNLSFTQGYRRFEDNTTSSITSLNLGNNPNPNASISSLTRAIPTEGTTHYSRFSFHRTFGDTFDITGRYIYSSTSTNFTFTERLMGTNRSGVPIVLDEYSAEGDSKKPNGFGDIAATWNVTDKFSISDTFGVNSYRISGGNFLARSIELGTVAITGLPVTDLDQVYRFTNFRKLVNTIEGSYDANKYLSFYAGYRYANRDVTLTGFDRDVASDSTSSFDETFGNKTHSLIAGFKAKPVPKIWTVYFDVEHGSADNVFTRLANYDFTQMRIRNQINATDNVSLNFMFETKDNDNPSLTTTVPPVNFGVSAKTRNFSSSVSWMASDKVSVNGGYNYSRLTSEAGVIFPITGGSASPGQSIYLLRTHYGYVDGFFKPHSRFSFFGAFRMSKDTGAGDSFDGPTRFIGGNYPLDFMSPEVRAIVRVTDNIDWNVGYQYYRFNEKFSDLQDYRAHLPYTSLRIYFGGAKDR